MKFLVITPSYNQINMLKLCISSVYDQVDKDITVHHHIQDGGSQDETVQWLSEYKKRVEGKNGYTFSFKSLPDNGMYDAINKGLNITEGDIISYLNCDEQYLPGTLNNVKNYFYKKFDVDIVFGHTLVTNPSGDLISYRKAYRASYNYIISSILYNMSCTMFFRRKIISNGIRFNTEYKDAGDADFVLRILKQGYRADYIKEYLSVFTWTGSNMSMGENALIEKEKLIKSAPKIIRKTSHLINLVRLIEKFFSGAYYQKFPLTYELYTTDSKNERKVITSANATFKWPKN